MHGVIGFVAAAALGIDVGWQPLPDGGSEYIIQIEPEMLETLRSGQDISSQLPPFLRDVRNYRITVGNREMPRVDPPPAAPPAGPPAGETPAGPATPAAADADSAARAGGPAPPAGSDARSPPTEEATAPPTLRAPTDAFPLTKRVAGFSDVTAEAGASPKPSARITGDHSASPSDALPATGDNADQSTPGKPWLPLLGAVVALFASLGANAYLGWNTWSLRGRYRSLLAQLHAT